jgi:K(+)-stimulated pyrophosphate-energized sodium pump
MNLVSLLIAPAVVTYSIGTDENDALRISIALVATAIIVTAVTISKRKPIAVGDGGTPGSGKADEAAPEPEHVNA